MCNTPGQEGSHPSGGKEEALGRIGQEGGSTPNPQLPPAKIEVRGCVRMASNYNRGVTQGTVPDILSDCNLK